MICDPCRTAADKKKTVPAKERWHAKCIGSNQCACQHKVRGKFINEKR